MSASPSEDEPLIHTPGGLGLHRGRRVLAGCFVLGLLIAGAVALVRSSEPSPAPPVAEVAPETPAIEPVVRPVAAPKRRAKSARMGIHGSARAVAGVEPLSALPLVPSAEIEAGGAAAAPGEEKVVVVEVPAEAVAEPGVVAAAAPVAVEAPVASAPAAAAAADPVEAAPEPVAVSAAAVASPPVAAGAVDDGNGEAIARAIADAKRAAVQACFERELKQTPTLTGTLIVELDLAPPHRVNGVRVSDDLERPTFTQCVSTTMEHVSFDALNEEVSIRVPYLLTARSK